MNLCETDQKNIFRNMILKKWKKSLVINLVFKDNHIFFQKDYYYEKQNFRDGSMCKLFLTN